MRFVLPLVALCAFSSAPLRADMFDITLMGQILGQSVMGSGTFTTDGICFVCDPFGHGMLSFSVNIDGDTGPNAFDMIDDGGSPSYDRITNNLGYRGTNSETGDVLFMEPPILPPQTQSIWFLVRDDSEIGNGTYTIAPAPEPSSLFLLMPNVALLGLRLRHRIDRTNL